MDNTNASSTTPTRPGPFVIKDCAALNLALGRSARNLRELREGVAQVPIGSIYHHFFHVLLRPSFDDPEYRNDFALWTRRQLRDTQLAERLDVIDPIDYEDFERLRKHLLGVIDSRLGEIERLPWALAGSRFHFLKSQIVVFDTRLSAATPEQLASLIPKMGTGGIFYHFIEARRRSPHRIDDFTEWLAGWGSSTEPIRRRLAGIDFYLWTLTELRELIAQCFVPRHTEALHR